ncbi:hypothetical protein ACTFIR_009379 [Dictyostelium discoideum]
MNWTSVPQTSLERIGSSKLLSRSRKWFKSPSTSKFQADAKPNSDLNSRWSEIRLHHKGSTRLVIRRCHRTSISKPLFKSHFLLQRVYGSKTWNESTGKFTSCSSENSCCDSIKGPVINAKEQRKGVLSILELTSLDDTNSQVCPVRHLSTYLTASKGRRKPHSGDSVFIQNEGKPLDVKEINIIVLSTLSSSGIDGVQP